MITTYKKKTSKNDMEIIEVNDAFFNKYTVELLDENAKDVASRWCAIIRWFRDKVLIGTSIYKFNYAV